jgi:serine/threonine protein kinase
MAKVIDACPNDKTFEKLGHNDLAESDREAVLEHIEKCDTCTRRVSAMSMDDSLVTLVRQAGKTPAVAGAGALVEEIRQLWPVANDDRETMDIRRARRQPGDIIDPQETTPTAYSSRWNVAEGNGPYDFLARPEQPDEIGRLGAYRALEVLGTGGMGVVFRAEDTLLRRQVALKVMLPGVAADPDGKARFLREARTAASIKHDHVVTIYRVDEERGIPFIAMELLSGESLEKRLERVPKMPAGEILRIAREIADGLAAAHDVGLVHRDIKPANIWLESREKVKKAEGANGKAAVSPAPLSSSRVKILDFGLACDARGDGRLTRKGVIVGTAAYMSPEQARGNTPDARGDLFSLGCVLYVMCTGKLPYTGSDFVSTLVSVVSHSPKHVREFDPTLPAELANLVMKLLEKDPADRPQTAQTLARDLAALEKGTRLHRKEKTRRGAALKSALAKKPAQSFWKRPRVLLSVAVVLALLTAGGSWLAAVVFRPTPQGIVAINSDDKNVLIRIILDGKPVAVLDPKTKKEINLNVGNYEMELLNGKGYKLNPSRLSIEDGKRSEIELVSEPRIDFKEKDMRFPPPDGKFGPPPPPDDRYGPFNNGKGDDFPPKKKGPPKGFPDDGGPGGKGGKDKGPKGGGFDKGGFDKKADARPSLDSSFVLSLSIPWCGRPACMFAEAGEPPAPRGTCAI